MDEFDIKKMFNEPDYTVDTKKYIDRFTKLLKDIDNHINDIKMQLQNAERMQMFALTSELIIAEYQREIILQTVNSLNFYSK